MRSVFVVNAGSSSLKYQLIDVETGDRLARGAVERIGEALSIATHVPERGEELIEELHIDDHVRAFQWVLAAFAEFGPDLDDVGLFAVGHRVVQGGARFSKPVIVDLDIESQIADLAPLAPLHNPANLVGIVSARNAFPDLPHVAVFDTAFHRTLPTAAWRYAIDRRVADLHRVRKYGFHGTSHQFVSRRTAELMGRPIDELKIIVLHLGNGASACAVDGGKSVETSMGMTPMDGLVMGTRSGSIDPGVLLHLMRTADMTAEQVDRLLNSQSGLLGLSGVGDMRDVELAAAAGIVAARETLDIVTHRLRGTVGEYLAQLGGADAIAFTGGIGEHSATIRAGAVDGMTWAGIDLDPELNADGPAERRISRDDSRVQLWVVPTNEELEIARQVAAVVG